MTRILKFVTLDLELGDAVKLTEIQGTLRSSVQDIVTARGEAFHSIGSKGNVFALSGYLSGEDRYSYFDQFNRYRMMARSLKLSTPEVVVPVFITAVKMTEVNPLGFFYQLTLQESRFLQLDGAETTSRWYYSSTEVYSDPTPKEGEYAIQVEDDSEYISQIWAHPNSTDGVDLSNLPYIGIWLWMDVLSPMVLYYVWDVEGNAAYLDVTSDVLEASTWYRILHHQSEFTEDPKNSDPFDWTRVYMIGFSISNGDENKIIVTVDDLGAYE